MQPTDLKGVDIRARVAEVLWRNPGLSRMELARLLKVDKSTLSRITGRLMDSGMVVEASRMDSGPRGGRRPVGLEVRGDWGLWLGLELQPEGFQGVLVDFSGVARGRFSGSWPVNGQTLPAVLERVGRDANRMSRELDVELRAVGLSVPGPVRPGNGIVERSRPLEIDSALDLAGMGRDILGLSTWVDKDINCACLAETHFNEPDMPRNFLYLLVESRDSGLALGLGIVIDGRLHRGDHGASGELLSVYRRDGFDQLAMDRSQLSRAGKDPVILRKVVIELAPQIALIANAMDIDRLILGGLFQRDFEDIGPMFEEEIGHRRTYPTLASAEIVRAHRGDDAVAYGAAVHFTENPAAQSYWRIT